ncbi:hypothetical protein ACHWQZ_G000730 [Mnemiopsis leidyi]
MSGVDDKLNKMEKKRVGRPKKVVKSPKKKSAQDSGEASSNNFDYCPCKEYLEDELSLECQNCNKYWHLCCVGLKGLSEEMVLSLESWQCQDCYTCPHSYQLSVPSTTDNGTLEIMVKNELKALQPVIKVTVENAVRNVLSKSVCSKEDIKNVVRSYADVTKESQKEVIQQAALSQSSKTVVESVVRQLDADKVEREKRRCNLVVLSAPEPSKDLSKEQKIAEDNQFCCSVLEIPSSNIEACWRAGKIDESKPEYRRPLIIKLKSEGLAQEWTNNGVGLKTANGHWINRDLCAADRKANFLSRQERRKRMEKKK